MIDINHKETLLKGKEEYLHSNKNIWLVRDFIKDLYLENNLDNLQFGTISKQLNINIDDVIEVCIKLEEEGKIEYQYDIRDTDLRLLDSSNTIQGAINIANRLFDEKDNLFDRIYMSIKLTKDYKEFLNKTKKV